MIINKNSALSLYDKDYIIINVIVLWFQFFQISRLNLGYSKCLAKYLKNNNNNNNNNDNYLKLIIVKPIVE